MRFSDLVYLTVEPPALATGPLWVDIGTNYDIERLLPADIPEGAFRCSLFVHDWNSFIQIAAKRATWRFCESAAEALSRQSGSA